MLEREIHPIGVLASQAKALKLVLQTPRCHPTKPSIQRHLTLCKLEMQTKEKHMWKQNEGGLGIRR
jgi:hypothetical protein